MDDLMIGLTGAASAEVTAENTAIALGSGDVPVFGTPALVGLMEAAAVNAIAGHLSPDDTTVGAWIEVAHLGATPVGGEVRAEAQLVAIEGRKLSFTLVAFDERQKVGEGRHHRMRVGRDRFLAKLAQ